MRIDLKNIIYGRVIRITKTYILVAFDGNIGICHISNVSDYHVKNINTFFKIGEWYNFLVLDNSIDKKYNLSYKAIHPLQLKYHEYTIPTPSGFKNIKKSLDQKLKFL